MSISNNVKFYNFMYVLEKFSDKNNILTIKDINMHLKQLFDVTLERRTIYSFVKDIKELGIDISDYSDNGKGYFINTHKLEEHEIRILLDSISANKCLSHKKTKIIAEKLCKMNNVYVEYGMNRQVYIDNRPKTRNEDMFAIIDTINTAIKEELKIEFNYCYYDETKELIVKQSPEGELRKYIANPISMILKDDYYYIILNIDKYDGLSNFRIDKMKNVKIINESRKSVKNIRGCENGFDPSEYSRKCIKMFIGEEKVVELEVNSQVLGHIIDEIGSNIEVVKLENDKYNVRFSCVYGNGLVKWILQFSAGAKVISPMELKNELIKEINEILQRY